MNQSLPPNVRIEAQPDYCIWIDPQDGLPRYQLEHRGRTTWKRETAISHARYIAQRWAKNKQVSVEIDRSPK